MNLIAFRSCLIVQKYVGLSLDPKEPRTISPSMMTLLIRLKKKNIDITNITIHEFRHSSASYMISNNISIEIIAYRLGDSVETIRKTYAHLFPDTQKDVKGLFNNL